MVGVPLSGADGEGYGVFKTLLIANRGEIAVRIMKTAKRLGIETVAVYSEADRGAMHTRVADRAVLIGPADAARSYLDKNRILLAAREAGADAIHPGYGFLSENAAFAEACAAARIAFVGPPAAAISAMGSKADAKTLMERAGVPVVRGYHGEMQSAEFLKRKAYEIGYPVLIKAIAGGGGKGMRRVDKAIDFDDALAEARREAKNAFGDDRVLVERFIKQPRHIEIQVFADTRGRTVSLHERDCSVQRRHQKIMEESPAPGMTPELRASMGRAAVMAAEAVGYVGAGTVEFIVEGGGELTEDGFFFMEMNTRLQVEHPVTEMVTGFDLVEWQLRVAAGEPLPSGEPRPPKGHALEVRLYAEDPDNGFLPSTGRLAALSFPEGVRVDTGAETGDRVSPFYDPMIAKMIVHADSRDAAFAAMRDALDRTVAIGPRTNLPFLAKLVTHPDILAANHDTGFVGHALDDLTGGTVSAEAVADAAASLVAAAEVPAPVESGFQNPWLARDGYRLTGHAASDVSLLVDGEPRFARLDSGPEGQTVSIDGIVGTVGGPRVIYADGDAFAVEAGRAVRVSLVEQLSREIAPDAAGGALAPMHGRIVAVHVSPGMTVAPGDKLFAIEAMKMEHTVKAVAEGVVLEVHAAAGDQVAERAEVIVLGPPGSVPAAPEPAEELPLAVPVETEPTAEASYDAGETAPVPEADGQAETAALGIDDDANNAADAEAANGDGAVGAALENEGPDGDGADDTAAPSPREY
ncbi:biotin carboxylase N-terminal domain-containing protein [Acuticoccus sp. MNP-M23]|uniref:acetyl/propionyl/methylcrotonyl-CoA carboxylase subunit alpha n=1 Tax=Acuticoccus sp. MNP-M23 TaxID=3072793 RepID=UPI00281669E0|nr:biotin carboxylase N-terminal domain-containing protein [Acuticoccus sp. MNP-M23]WMS41149.1 biotin carboxylase N-terminal domain-containing protein [Acuticoccus sp. MNP-M23]